MGPSRREERRAAAPSEKKGLVRKWSRRKSVPVRSQRTLKGNKNSVLHSSKVGLSQDGEKIEARSRSSTGSISGYQRQKSRMDDTQRVGTLQRTERIHQRLAGMGEWLHVRTCLT